MFIQEVILIRFSHFLKIFVHVMTWPRARLYCKLQYKIVFFMFCLLCCSIVFFCCFLVIFVRLGGQKPTKNRANIDQKRDAKLDAWVALGGLLGSKMAPRWRSNGHPKPIQNDIGKQGHAKVTQEIPTRCGCMQVLCEKGSLPSLK